MENRLSELSNTISTKALTAADPDPSWSRACRSSCRLVGGYEYDGDVFVGDGVR